MRTGHTTTAGRRLDVVVTAGLLAIASVAYADEAAGPDDVLGDTSSTSSDARATTTTKRPTTTDAPTTTTTTEAPTTTTTIPVVSSGTYVVPDQFAPGTYRVEGYWARLDANRGIIDNNISDGNVFAVVQPGDWALSYTGTIEAMR